MSFSGTAHRTDAGQGPVGAQAALAVWPRGFAVLAGLLCGGGFAFLPHKQGISYLLPFGIALLGIGLTIALGWFFGRSGEDRESAYQPGPKARFAFVLSLTIAGLLIRLYGVNFGLPGHRFHPDEDVKARVITSMLKRHTFNPQYFLHPTLLLYLTMAMNAVLKLAGAYHGWPADRVIVFAGRLVSCFAGALTIPCLYVVARRFLSVQSALVAAALFAFFPLSVTLSRHVKEDALMVFFVVLTAALAQESAFRRSRGLFLLAALTAGLAAGSKYPGALCVAFVLGAPWRTAPNPLRPDNRLLWLLPAAALLAAGGFLVGCPYSLVSTQKFLVDLAYERRHMRQGHGTFISPWEHLWTFGVVESLVPGMVIPVCIAALFGGGLMAARRPRDAFILWGAFLLYYLPAEQAAAKTDRYLYPCLPPLAIFAAYTVSWLSTRRSALTLVAATCLLVSPVLRTLVLASELRSDSRLEMLEWMRAHIPRGARVVVPFKAYSPVLSRDEFNVVYLRGARNKKLARAELRKMGAQYVLLSSAYYNRFVCYGDKARRSTKPLLDLLRDAPRAHTIEKPWARYSYHNPTQILVDVRAYKHRTWRKEEAVPRPLS